MYRVQSKNLNYDNELQMNIFTNIECSKIKFNQASLVFVINFSKCDIYDTAPKCFTFFHKIIEWAENL